MGFWRSRFGPIDQTQLTDKQRARLASARLNREITFERGFAKFIGFWGRVAGPFSAALVVALVAAVLVISRAWISRATGILLIGLGALAAAFRSAFHSHLGRRSRWPRSNRRRSS